MFEGEFTHLPAPVVTSVRLSTLQAPEPELVTFSDLPEGQVGRLQIMKSGRARLLLGDHVLHLDAGTQLKFLQVRAGSRR